ncbi:MAG: flagellar biosynthetic protein FliO [Succinivibrio sp.]|nr:flagellar biosynthetic protein FliO [Succinivibrio sp.]MCI7773741.1 flagellar biosynthetic protein FliO [Succinivibrio sp.]
MFSSAVCAQENVATRPITSLKDILLWLISTIVVVACIFVLAFFLKKIKFVKGKNATLAIVDQLYVGPKQRVVMVKSGERKILLGVTPNHINYLTEVKDSHDKFSECLAEHQEPKAYDHKTSD